MVVQNGDDAHSGNTRQAADYRYKAGPEKVT